jgi:beta-galactosidase
MEQQPGPVNWAPYNPAPLPGMVRLWTWEAIAHGAEVVSYFRWRQAPFGQEQMHSGLQRPDGAGAAGANEVKSMVPDLAKLSDQKITPSPVGLVFDYASAWAWETQQQCQDFDYFGLVYDVYRGLRRLGLSVDIIPPDTDSFGDKKLVCIPGLFAWTSELKRALQDFSGQVLIGPRSGSKTREFKIPDHMPPNIPGFECKIKSIETLRSGAKIALENGGHFHIWREFAQTEISPSEMTKDGQPAIISQGGMSYLAGWPDDEAMTRILSNIAMDAGIDIHIMTDGKRRRAFGDFTLHLDYGTGDVKVVNNKTHKSLLT